MLFLCSSHVKIADYVLMEPFLGEAFNSKEIIIDMSVTVIYNTFYFLQLFYDELATLKNVDLYLSVLCAIDGGRILSVVDERLQFDLNPLDHFFYDSRLVMLVQQYFWTFGVEMTQGCIQLLYI